MRGADLLSIEPLRARSLSLRKSSLLRKYAAGVTDAQSETSSSTVSSYRHFKTAAKKKKKRKGRRSVRFAPLVDVYETSLPEDFTQDEFEALWINATDYENAKKEFTQVIMILQELEFADLFLDETELPPDHVLHDHCSRGCEKYFDMELRFKIRQIITVQVLQFYQQRPQNPEALRLYAQALTAECTDLAVWHGHLNALQCWGNLLQRYQNLKRGISRQVCNYSLSQTFSQDKDECARDEVEVILDPSAKSGCRTLSVDL